MWNLLRLLGAASLLLAACQPTSHGPEPTAVAAGAGARATPEPGAAAVVSPVTATASLGSEPSTAEYVQLLALAYRAAKGADPDVTVLAAGLSPTGIVDGTAQPDDAYLRWMYAAGAQAYFDVLGAHANVQCPCVEAAPGSVAGFEHPSFYFRRVEQLREIMVEHGDADKQVWLLEFGWTTDAVNPSYAWYATTEERKAELIVEAFRYVEAHWSPWIGVMTLWTIADPAWGPQDEQVWWAVTNPDGSPRRAYERLQRAVESGELPVAARTATVRQRLGG